MLAGAIGRRAEAIYAGSTSDGRRRSSRVFLRLVTVSEDHGDTRRRVRRTELEQSGIGADDLRQCSTSTGATDCSTFDRDPTSRTPTVEVAHESLLSEWERFAGWVDDAREDLLTRRRVESAANDWMSSGSDPSFLYGGGRLELAESWVASSGFELTDDERRFLATSREKVDRDQTSCAPAAVGLVVGAARGGAGRGDAGAPRSPRATEQRRTPAQAEADNAELDDAGQASRADAAADNATRKLSAPIRAGTLAEARRIGTQALVEDDYDQALLLAVEGRHLEDSPETRANLLATIQRSPDAIAVIRSETEAFLDLGLTPDGKTLLASGIGGPSSMSTYDVTTREPEASITTGSRVSSAVSPDGRLAVMSSLPARRRQSELTLVDMATFAVVGTLPLATFEGAADTPVVQPGRQVHRRRDGPRSLRGWSRTQDRVRLGRGQGRRTGRSVRVLGAELPARRRPSSPTPDGSSWLAPTALRSSTSPPGAEVGQIAGAYPPLAVSPDGRTLAAATDMSQESSSVCSI